MTTTLRASIFSVLGTIVAFGAPQGSFADGRSDWADYAWQTIPIAECVQSGTSLTCPQYHEKWDWKRNQWVDVVVTMDLAAGNLSLTQTPTDNDGHDSDYVCVTALLTDEDGRNIVAHHQNWHMFPGDRRTEAFAYSANNLVDAAAIQIGSKQCRQGGNQDDVLYQSVLAGIAR